MNWVSDGETATVARYRPSGLNCTSFSAFGPRGEGGSAATRPVRESTAYMFEGVFGVTAGFNRTTRVRRSGDQAPPKKRLSGPNRAGSSNEETARPPAEDTARPGLHERPSFLVRGPDEELPTVGGGEDGLVPARERTKDAHRVRAPFERRQQVPTRLDRVVDGDALPGQQQGELEVSLVERLCAQPLGERVDGRASRSDALSARLLSRATGLTPLHERQRARDQRDHQERGHADEEPAQPAVRPALSLRLTLRGFAAGVEELPLEVVELPAVQGRPVEGRRQTRSPVQLT